MPPKEAAGTADGYAAGVKAEVAIARTRADVAHRQAELEQRGLVACPRGNVSARIGAAELFVIAPAGAFLDKISPERMVVCDLDGAALPEVLGSDRLPSADAPVHSRIYRDVPTANAIVHTDSPFALAWAARAETLPCLTTAAAEDFGGAVPVIAPDLADPAAIGEAVVSELSSGRAVALVRAVGVFAVGSDLREALRRASSLEVAARHAVLVSATGPVEALAIDDAVAVALHDRARRRATSVPDAHTLGSGLSHN
ncbi:class II aldolase/adducin family protein [Microbacterium sp. bgisy207]|uniref:class II aldolase/adducin family protein n=1 Tax=Microbacterium sp. bgisy207 TaxID=3413800 RepID=UPI003EB6A073